MKGKIDLSARRQVTNKLRDAYGRASKADKARILDEVQAATGVARSMARRLLSGPRLSDLAAQVDRRQLRRRGYGDSACELPQMGVRLSSAAANSQCLFWACPRISQRNSDIGRPKGLSQSHAPASPVP